MKAVFIAINLLGEIDSSLSLTFGLHHLFAYSSYMTEGFIKNNVLILILYEIYSSFIDGFPPHIINRFRRRIFQCSALPIVENTCEAGPEINTIFYDYTATTSCQMRDKLISLNSKNQLFVGINEYHTSFSGNCTNGVAYQQLPLGSYIKNLLVSCDNPYSSYTRFVLLFSDERILNIGFNAGRC